ncbi:hypothetical protein Forpi1262_v014237 [Fusarium oxysporum f. sp. raphani]|uniref:Uncharacterized protein n=1 Tax=Fusarium oxysporum f. sp. raphani TaxID=96318 RepID=A0A8J5UJV1_FUSOX|nr:hypothetical protein Forpi1262_v014237 [Fusarium oxysporum f. sp. raphani]
MPSTSIELRRPTASWNGEAGHVTPSNPDITEEQSFEGHTQFSLPPVDGGKDAWLFLFAAFLLEALAFPSLSASFKPTTTVMSHSPDCLE